MELKYERNWSTKNVNSKWFSSVNMKFSILYSLPGSGADPIWSEPESAPGPRTSGAGAAKKVAAPQH